MTVQEIFNLPEIEEIEEEIVFLSECKPDDYESETIKRLLPIRQRLLNRHFVMDGQYKLLLEKFNDAMRQQLIEMRKETIKAYNAVAGAGLRGETEAVGKCFLGYEYSQSHPVQTERAVRMWNILNGTLDKYVALYWDGIIMGGYRYDGNGDSENRMLYLQEDVDNWNEGLDAEMTNDMHLIHAFHHLYEHTDFSIFDLLWVRKFNIEIHIVTDYRSK